MEPRKTLCFNQHDNVGPGVDVTTCAACAQTRPQITPSMWETLSVRLVRFTLGRVLYYCKVEFTRAETMCQEACRIFAARPSFCARGSHLTFLKIASLLQCFDVRPSFGAKGFRLTLQNRNFTTVFDVRP